MTASRRSELAVTGVGFATAQGCGADLLATAEMVGARALDPPRAGPAPPQIGRLARGLPPGLAGISRVAALARDALDECLAREPVVAGATLVVASCNGGATTWDADDFRRGFIADPWLVGTPWEGERVPVVSGACASGLQALYLAQRAVTAGAPEAVVLAVDIDSPAARDGFEALRILAAQPEAPWQAGTTGFILGEAAVALRIGARASEATPRISDIALGNDLAGDDGLGRVLASLALAAPALALGQATGTEAVDRRELDVISARLPREVPLSTPSYHFGHTLGASSLLSVALGVLAWGQSLPGALALPGSTAVDGRRLLTGAARSRETVVLCRALGGACGACVVGGHRSDGSRGGRAAATWFAPSPAPPLRDPILREVAASALAHRPAAPPDLLVVDLEAPLRPRADTLVGGRLLPSSLLELTPGFVAQLVARSWGFGGAAVSVVSSGAQDAMTSLLDACRTAGDSVFRIDILGTGERRHVIWNA